MSDIAGEAPASGPAADPPFSAGLGPLLILTTAYILNFIDRQILGVLNVPITYFFEGLDITEDDESLNPRQRMCLELARNFASISNQRHQEALSQLARALAVQQ